MQRENSNIENGNTELEIQLSDLSTAYESAKSNIRTMFSDMADHNREVIRKAEADIATSRTAFEAQQAQIKEAQQNIQGQNGSGPAYQPASAQIMEQSTLDATHRMAEMRGDAALIEKLRTHSTVEWSNEQMAEVVRLFGENAADLVGTFHKFQAE